VPVGRPCANADVGVARIANNAHTNRFEIIGRLLLRTSPLSNRNALRWVQPGDEWRDTSGGDEWIGQGVGPPSN
jgi:hypothetical protein